MMIIGTVLMHSDIDNSDENDDEEDNNCIDDDEEDDGIDGNGNDDGVADVVCRYGDRTTLHSSASSPLDQ